MPPADDRPGSGQPRAPFLDRDTLGSAGEGGILEAVLGAFAGLPTDGVLVGPGDDTALLAVARGGVLATTDTMVLGRDWLEEWSSAHDVGVKAVTQNLADLASMGGVGTGLLLTLVAPPDLPLAWAQELSDGIAWAAGRAGVPVVGGDLSSAPPGLVAVSITALGELGEGVAAPVLRSGARAGDVLAVSGPLGRSGAGWALLREGVLEGRDERETQLLDHHRRPLTDLSQGPTAARAGATAMIDVSDGLVRDADRIARASGVVIDLDRTAVAALAERLGAGLAQDAVRLVLSGGEEHELLATFPDAVSVPPGWSVLGTVAEPGSPEDGSAPAGVRLAGRTLDPRVGGWDHFGG